METTEDQKAVAAFLTDKRRVEISLPSTMLWSVLAQLQKREGFLVRPDILQSLDVAAVSPLKGLTSDRVSKIARRSVRDSETLIRAMNCENRRLTVLACCQFVLHLVDEGRFPDPRNAAVLCALGIRHEAETDPESDWGWSETAVVDAARKGVRHAELMGYYERPLFGPVRLAEGG